jgi:hypothetical protein
MNHPIYLSVLSRSQIFLLLLYNLKIMEIIYKLLPLFFTSDQRCKYNAPYKAIQFMNHPIYLSVLSRSLIFLFLLYNLKIMEIIYKLLPLFFTSDQQCKYNAPYKAIQFMNHPIYLSVLSRSLNFLFLLYNLNIMEIIYKLLPLFFTSEWHPLSNRLEDATRM